MKIILKTDVSKVGNRGEVVEVADGYALNFLIPQGKAQFATPEAEAEIQQTQAIKNAKVEASREEVQSVIQSLDGQTVEITAKANEDGTLFASLQVEDVIQAVDEQYNVTLPNEVITLEAPVKTTGTHSIKLASGDASATLSLEVTGTNSDLKTK